MAGCSSTSVPPSPFAPASAPNADLAAVRLAEDLRVADSPVLRQALGSADAGLRARAAQAMGRIQTPAYAEPLAERARTDAAPEVRKAALFALGELSLAEGAVPPPAAVRAAESALADPNPEIAVAAVEALGKLAPPGAAARLVPLLADERRAIRAEAAYALFRLRFVPVWRGESEAPPPLPDDAVAALVAAFDDPEPEVRRAAVYAFSRYGERRAVAGLASRLLDEDPWTRVFAARALGRSGEETAAKALASRLSDPHAAVRAETVAALAALKRADMLPPSLTRDRSFHVRAAGARALGELDSPSAVEGLRSLQKDLSPTVRAAAIEALGKRLRGGMKGELEGLLNAAAWTDRVAAVRAAAQVEGAELPLLARAFADSDRRVQTAAVEAVGNLAGTSAAEADALLVRALTVPDLAVRATAVTAVAKRESIDRLARLEEAYAGSAGLDWVEVREGVVDALAELGEGEKPVDASELLRRIAAGDSAPSVRSRARLALAKRGIEAPAAQPAADGGPAASPMTANKLSPHLGASFDRDPVIVMETSKGAIEIQCLAAAAPIHCANFVELVGKRYYDGLIWHRVVSNFVIQGGDPRGDGFGGPGYNLRDEVSTRRFVAGTVGMPKAGKDTGGGQIFITHLPTPHLDGNYTVFGQVIRGLEVVQAIEVGDAIVRARLRP